jgi:hypothetical protein
MAKIKLTLLIIIVISTACSSNKGVPDSSNKGVSEPRASTIAGTLSSSNSPMQNAEIKLKSYKDENCVKLGQKNKLSQEEDQQFKQCHQQVSSTTSDAQGKYAFPNITDGWYSVEVNWTTKENPVKGNLLPFFVHRKEGFLITFIATKDSTYHVLAVGEPFQFSAGNTGQKDLTLKL